MIMKSTFKNSGIVLLILLAASTAHAGSLADEFDQLSTTNKQARDQAARQAHEAYQEQLRAQALKEQNDTLNRRYGAVLSRNNISAKEIGLNAEFNGCTRGGIDAGEASTGEKKCIYTIDVRGNVCRIMIANFSSREGEQLYDVITCEPKPGQKPLNLPTPGHSYYESGSRSYSSSSPAENGNRYGRNSEWDRLRNGENINRR